MSVILRAYGKDFDVDALLDASTLPVSNAWMRGEPYRDDKPNGKRHKNSAVFVEVSDADFDQFEQMVDDAIRFLEANADEVRALVTFPGVDEEVMLDFGVEQGHFAARFNHFPARLVRLCGELGLALHLSSYMISDSSEGSCAVGSDEEE